MAELHVTEDERPGILKEIDEGAMDLIFQAIQEDIYSFPIKSFVRESISNGLDAIIERDIYKAIKAGDPVEKYFLQRDDGKLLKDSSYDPTYYNENHLSEHNKVYVTYTEGSPRDKIIIEDYGVGLGGNRLKGFFKLGYSSKRNMKLVMGKFGAGAKAGLATGVEYFVVTTIYNGYKTSFMIFKNDYEAITPQHPEAKVEEWKVQMSNGDTQTRNIFWEKTHEPNGVLIELEVKKHNKQAYINAVTDQFQYFKGKVHLTIIDEDGIKETNTLDQDPEYESDTILIPRYSTYTAPHILVDGISYGLISWDELELERRQGKIAVKVHATDVDITQSRESLKWTEKTKATILKAVKKAKVEAEAYVTKYLTLENPEDIFELNNKYASIGFNSGDNVAKVFGKFLDMYSIVPKYDLKFPDHKESKNFYLSGDFFDFFFYSFDLKLLTLSGNKITTEKVDNFSALQNSIIVFAEEKHVGPKLMGHLLAKYEVDSIIYVRYNSTRIKTSLEVHLKTYSVSTLKAYVTDILRRYSTVHLDVYEVQYDETEDSINDKVSTPSNILAMRRKLNKEVLVTVNENFAVCENWGKTIDFSLGQNRITYKISDLKKAFQNKEVVICTGKYKGLGRIIEIVNTVYPNPKLEVIYIAQDLVHHFLPYGTLITDYFRKVNTETGELMIGEHIRNLNTWRKTYEIIEKYPYVNKYDLLKAITTIDISQLKNVRQNSQDFDFKDIILRSDTLAVDVLTDILSYMDSLIEFQSTVKSLDSAAIAKHALELFNSDKIYHIDAYDEHFISTLEAELERLRPIENLIECCEDYADYSKATPLFNLLLTTLEKQNNDNI